MKFTNANTAKNPTLNVNGKGAKAIYAEGTATTYSWAAGDVDVVSAVTVNSTTANTSETGAHTHNVKMTK